MLKNEIADKLTGIAIRQLSEGLKVKEPRMKIISEIDDLYNNKVLEMDDEVMNIPFPIMAGHVDLLYSKIDNPPTLEFKIPNKAILSEKVKSAWMQDMNSTRAGWKRKDRVEKKMAVKSGRAVCKIYGSSFQGKYKSHYDIVDIYSFVADPMHGDLDAGNYHGETDIFKTKSHLEEMAKLGVYDEKQVEKLATNQSQKDANPEVLKHKFDRLKAMGSDMQTTSFAGQDGVNLTEWIMRHEGELYYLLFEPKTGIWVRAEKLSDVFANGKTPYVSWATNYDEYNFWSKGPADDIYPIAEAMRFLLNTALENEKRRTRPMRIVDSGALMDVNELQDYVPDNVILRNPGRDPNIVDVVTPEITTTINLAQYMDSLIQAKSGVTEPGVQEKDAKVGVFYGQLAMQADRIGTYNKEYSESYARKGYNYFWTLKEHLSKPKQVEMLGGGGIKLQELTKFDLKDVDDVDDILVSGGSQEAELNAVKNEQQRTTVNELAAAYPNHMLPEFVIRTNLEIAGFDEDVIEAALDVQGADNRQSMEQADSAIQDVLLGNDLRLNQAADVAYAQRILDYVKYNMSYVELDSEGNEEGIDKKMEKQAQDLLKHVNAHAQIIARNMARKAAEAQTQQLEAQMGMQTQQEGAQGQIDIPGATQQDQQLALARPFEGTGGGTASQSQNITQTLS